jgi:PAS domain S-box-containing protein
MPTLDPADRHLNRRLQRLRHNRAASFAIAIGAVVIATIVRWVLADYLPEGLPFITYFIAVAAAALFGGFWAGILAIVTSAGVAYYLFLPPPFGFAFSEANAVALALFIFFSGLLVLIITALNMALQRSLSLEDSLEAEIDRCRRAEHDASRLVAVVESSADAIVTKDLNGIITSWNRGAERIFGYSAEEAIGKSVTILIPPNRIDEETEILQRVRRGEGVDYYETVRRRKDGGLIDISLAVSPIKSPDGEIVGASKIARDITERKRLQEQQKLVVSEMKHRIKNSLMTIQAVANQTLKNRSERDAFIGRLHALDRAHDMLTSEIWEKASLNAAINRALEPFHEQVGTRIAVDGVFHLWLEPTKALMVAMVMHELATNAIKYGALSNGTGRVDVTWERHSNPDLVKLVWQETGGPTVSAPKRKGFGSHLIERAFGAQLGHSQLVFNPSGLLCTLEITL